MNGSGCVPIKLYLHKQVVDLTWVRPLGSLLSWSIVLLFMFFCHTNIFHFDTINFFCLLMYGLCFLCSLFIL